jgi:hypothetical protein
MKTLLIISVFLVASAKLSAQSILLINDNNNITQNTDTFLLAMQNSNFANYTYYNLVDSAGMPSVNYLSNFDILIYYASTDGFGLGLWDNGQSGNNAIKSFLIDGGRAWFIGSDILYAGTYSVPSTFAPTSFPYLYMGLTSYDSQSYGDDGGIGVSEIFRKTAAPGSFPASLQWTLGSLWWVDGVTSRPGAIELYEMGPSSYPLYEAVCMTHYYDFETNALSSFFDPALILGSTTDRIDFINASLDYLWSFDLGIHSQAQESTPIKLYPTVSDTEITVELLSDLEIPYEIYASSGVLVASGVLNAPVNVVDVKNFSSGVYFIKAENSVEKFIVN